MRRVNWNTDDADKNPDCNPLNPCYYPHNTGKEVILKLMSSNHSEVAAA